MQPSGLDDELVDLTELGQVDALGGGPGPHFLDGLCVHPLSPLGVSLDFEILGELLAADRPPLAEEALDLFEDQGVALDRRRVVSLLIPDALPDRLGLGGKWQPADAVEIVDCPVQGAENVRTAWTTSTSRRHSTY